MEKLVPRRFQSLLTTDAKVKKREEDKTKKKKKINQKNIKNEQKKKVAITQYHLTTP